MDASIANRTFGIELETIIPTLRYVEIVQRIREFDPTIRITATNSHRTTNPARTWIIKPDGSLNGPGIGAEFVSPILKGQEGLDNVQAMCRALAHIGATVNRSCGFHVHCGASDLPLPALKNLVKLYARYEEAIDSIMPPSRRDNANRYLQSVRNLATAAAIDAAPSVARLGNDVIRGKYHKLNIASVELRGTVEFRHHSGTVDATKVTNWVLTCLRMCAAAKSGKTGAGGQPPTVDLSALPPKARDVVSLMIRPQGSTNEEVRAAFGYRTISSKRQAEIAGLDFYTVKERGTVRFFVRSADGTETPTTLEGLAAVIGATEAERAYLIARSAATYPATA